MEKNRKKEIVEIIARHASDDYLAGYLNGYKAAQVAKSQTEQDKKPA